MHHQHVICSCTAEAHNKLKYGTDAEWIEGTNPIPYRPELELGLDFAYQCGQDMPGTEQRNCRSCDSTILRVVNQSEWDAYLDSFNTEASL